MAVSNKGQSSVIDIGESDGKLQSFTLHPGDAIKVPAGVRHRMKAIEDTTIFEVSTPELNDMIRIEDDYGRVGRVLLTKLCLFSRQITTLVTKF